MPQPLAFLELGENAIVILLSILAPSIIFLVYVSRRTPRYKNLPRGSLGFPVVGETWSFLKAQREDRGADWIKKRVEEHGPVFKTSIMGSPTVVVTGQAGNKFLFMANEESLAMKHPPTIVGIAGRHNIFELNGERYRYVKSAFFNFLKPDNLQEYVGKMDELIKSKLLIETKGKDTVMAVQLMKKLTFHITCSLLFGLYNEDEKQALFADFSEAFKAIWSIPVNLPGTTFSRGLRARARIIKRLRPIVHERRELILKGKTSTTDDVISSLVALELTDEEVLDNLIALIIASHDTVAVLLNLMVWKLANDPAVYDKVLQEHMDIIRERGEPKQSLAWNEVQKMKFTWRVAQELMRLIPPVFGNFRKTLKDINFAGLDIPKGWQVFWVATVTHMDSEVFADPTVFDPSRFQSPSTPIPRYTYIPFGAGPRMCIGNEFARVVALVIIHNMVTNFDQWSPLVPDEKITRQPMPYPSMGLPIKLHPKARE